MPTGNVRALCMTCSLVCEPVLLMVSSCFWCSCHISLTWLSDCGQGLYYTNNWAHKQLGYKHICTRACTTTDHAVE